MGKIVVYSLILAILVIFGCAGQNNAGQAGNGDLYVSMTDAAANMGAISNVNVTVDQVKVKTKASGWVTVSSEEKTYDLLELKQNSKAMVIAHSSIPAGEVEEVELNIKSATVIDNDGTHKAIMPSNKVNVKSTFNARQNETTAVSFDFIANESLHVAENRDYVFAPVAQVETRENTSVTVNSDNSASLQGGTVRSSNKFGMSINGTVGIGLGIAADAEIKISNGVISVDVGGILGSSGDGTDSTEVSASTNSFLAIAGMVPAYKVEYDMTAIAAGTATSSKLSMYFKSPKYRTDSTITAAGTTIESRAIFTGSKIYSCSKVEGIWSCLETTVSASANAAASTQSIQNNPADYAITADGTMVVAGETASCYKVVANDSSYTTRYCYTSSGFPVYIKTEASGYVSELTATSFSQTVVDADFEVPAEPTTMPTYPGIPGYT